MSAHAIDVPRPLELPAESDLRFSLPLYKKKEAARLVDVAPATFRNWCKDGMVTVVDKTREGFSVPFAGVAEAAMISALRRLPSPPSLQSLKKMIRAMKKKYPGIDSHWLISERFYTAGSDLLVEMSRDPSKLSDLLKPPIMQTVFVEAVRDDIESIKDKLELSSSLRFDFCGRGYARRMHPPAYKPDTGVFIDPGRGSGRPVFLRRGILVDVIVGAFLAGETIKDLSVDYKIPESDIEDALRVYKAA